MNAEKNTEENTMTANEIKFIEHLRNSENPVQEFERMVNFIKLLRGEGAE